MSCRVNVRRAGSTALGLGVSGYPGSDWLGNQIIPETCERVPKSDGARGALSVHNPRGGGDLVDFVDDTLTNP